MGLFSNVGEFLFGKRPDVAGAQTQIQQGQNQALDQLRMGLGNAATTLQPTINQGNEYTNQIRNLLMGTGDASSMPGYNAMSNARRDAIADLGTGMAGAGKFFSGTTANQAADIGGAMENQFRQQTLQNLMMGAQPGQQATSQLAGYQMNTGQAGAQIPMTAGTNIANLMMADQRDGNLGDILGAAGTIGGFMMGGPAGAAAGSQLGGM